ncbi:hypothetical protein [Kozakia baliensis]|uniref:Uncharacterized protein n=1 Tax=Kozakia baliensis TaxID=153496 RepID=A0A1D8UVN0_9PROT|nr:hypothetical protein [Kozakia baliensis]AOX17709.1 hypothetical protein A0U89_11785 [Kozakia baliensis]GBR31618.1 hypothetical protein AA0488_2328 [Kozakia baliensis NRIC 0488]GEL62778.1 hypothetical protein KBA01_00640 [Kozakia baliensis]
MPAFDSYFTLASVTGTEVLVLASADGVETLNATASQIAGAPADSTPSGEFYANEGGKISRYGDRIFVGAASDYPALNTRDVPKQDWLSDIMAGTSIGPWAMQNAQSASLSRFGTSAFVAGSRTSDAQSAAEMLGYVPSSIGVASWGVADETQNPTTTTAYAYYGEAWRLAGVNYQPSFAMELEAVNLGGSASGVSTPFHPNCGGGTYGIQLGAGGGQTTGTSDAEAGVVFVSNPNAWKTGILFGNTAIAGTNGTDGGYGSAVSMARNQGIEWRTPETREGVEGIDCGAMLFSTVDISQQGQRIQFSDDGLLITNMRGELLFSISPNASPTNTLNIQAGSGPAAAGLYVQEGPNGSANLGLYPAAGGELQISSPVSNAGGAMPATAAGGFLHININGHDYRIALLSSEQAGG